MLQSSHTLAGAYTSYRFSVIHYIFQRTRDYEAAEDLSQDAFLRLAEYKDTLQKDKIRNFLFAIAHNLTIDYLRHSRKVQEANTYMQCTVLGASNETEESVLANDLLALEKRRLAALPERCKSVYSMVRFENQSLAEVAKEMHLSKSTVENYLSAGRKDIRAFIRKHI